MFQQACRIILFLVFITSCTFKPESTTVMGRFRVKSDLFLAQFDSKTDVDDIHSVAGVATMLKDPRFALVRYHAVAGAYGIQEGLYVPANELFKICFGDNWSDAHTNYDKALNEVTLLVTSTLEKGGNIWIAEAGQSDFSADLIRNIKTVIPSIDTKTRIHIVQHSDWNEKSASPEDLTYVKENSSYFKIPDGNAVGNGSPGFKTDMKVNWRKYITKQKTIGLWEKALEIADNYNGKEERYLNPAIANGGLDFSDVSETCWIFGFNHLKDVEEFFKEFSTSSGL